MARYIYTRATNLLDTRGCSLEARAGIYISGTDSTAGSYIRARRERSVCRGTILGFMERAAANFAGHHAPGGLV